MKILPATVFCSANPTVTKYELWFGFDDDNLALMAKVKQFAQNSPVLLDRGSRHLRCPRLHLRRFVFRVARRKLASLDLITGTFALVALAKQLKSELGFGFDDGPATYCFGLGGLGRAVLRCFA